MAHRIPVTLWKSLMLVALCVVVAKDFAGASALRVDAAQPNCLSSTPGEGVTVVVSGDFGPSAPVPASNLMCLLGSSAQSALAGTWISSTRVQCDLPAANAMPASVDFVLRDYTYQLLPAKYMQLRITLDSNATRVPGWLPVFTPPATSLSGLVPDRGPIGGNTHVTVSSVGAIDNRDLRCKFGTVETNGNFIDATSYHCTSATVGSPGLVDVELKTEPTQMSMGVYLDGVDDYGVAPIPVAELSLNMTFETWWRPAEIRGRLQALIQSCVPGETPETNCEFWITVARPSATDPNLSAFGFGHEFYNGQNQEDNYYVLPLSAQSQWQHVSVVREIWDPTLAVCSTAGCPAIGEYRVYWNGELAGEPYQFTVNTMNGTTNTYVGALYTTSFFKGVIDDVRIVDYPKTQAQVQQGMHDVYTGYEPGTIVSWDFEPNHQVFSVTSYQSDMVTPHQYTNFITTPSNPTVPYQLNMGGGTALFAGQIVQAVAFAEFPAAPSGLQFLYYTPETITDFAPQHGRTSGGTVVTVYGTGFLNSTYLSCRFGLADPTPANFINSTTLTCISPAYSICSQGSESLVIQLFVSNNNQQFVVAAANFTYYQPATIQSVSPTQAPLTSTFPVTIFGSGFISTPEFRCLFGSHASVPLSITPTQVVCYPPPADSGEIVVVSVTMEGQTSPASQVIFTLFDQWSVVETTAVGIAIFMGICFAIVVFVHIWLFVHRNDKAVKASAPLFGQFILFGAYLGFGAVSAFFATPTDASCTVGIWFVFLSFSFMFASLFIKNWRIQHIFNNKKLDKAASKNLTDLRLSIALFFVVGIMIIILAVWTGTADDKVQIDDEGFASCYVNPTFQGILFAYMGVMMLFGIILAIRTRNIKEDAFNESRLISVAIYNVSFVTIIMIPLVTFTTDVRALLVMKSVGILFAVMVTVGLLFFPKIWQAAIHQRRVARMRNSSDQNTPGPTNSNTNAASARAGGINSPRGSQNNEGSQTRQTHSHVSHPSSDEAAVDMMQLPMSEFKSPSEQLRA
ncbi:hypothetical protein CAOG_00213 [Capsaspora owczarzaki ATCC 30864]|uniref:G-protein coupled receptors family 3 profile domain-containing protein n=1 Tax=Capsaspora owczarzaki (strain ATCC 30864) TaxID=595528 RepID=A0A0D2WGM3_CAPO3|nr:hypothetical protein CAOG_00213 [Capsaspora owczarzaki ATCC 30864]KJE88575.1 hypothetical protein CAOG_000213 [Capsaspora owczarzaki ATCC 30864]|eukprot:XP_004365084.1 hypothetical protein CAOG_00213 [Capsaspora owczarzaki ATCC 30864]